MTVIKPAVSVFLAVFLAAAAPALAGDAEKGKDRSILCAACHGVTGISKFPSIPHLAGQNAGYLAAQLKAFRRTALGQAAAGGHSRHDLVMDHQAARLTDDDVKNLAAYFSGLPCRSPAKPAGGPQPKKAGRCFICHGAEGRSDNPIIPRLAGQQERYLENQLRSFHDSDTAKTDAAVRRQRHHPIMDPQVTRLGDADFRSLARYFSTRRCR